MTEMSRVEKRMGNSSSNQGTYLSALRGTLGAPDDTRTLPSGSEKVFPHPL